MFLDGNDFYGNDFLKKTISGILTIIQNWNRYFSGKDKRRLRHYLDYNWFLQNGFPGCKATIK
jgi:hypothetical protein